MKTHYDPKTDALYVRLADAPVEYRRRRWRLHAVSRAGYGRARISS